MLICQHVESLERPSGRVHLVNVEEIVREACDHAAKLCNEYSGATPPLDIHATASASTPLMASHLHHMVSRVYCLIREITATSVFTQWSPYV